MADDETGTDVPRNPTPTPPSVPDLAAAVEPADTPPTPADPSGPDLAVAVRVRALYNALAAEYENRPMSPAVGRFLGEALAALGG